jgi:iduronate 2-sulfatase
LEPVRLSRALHIWLLLLPPPLLLLLTKPLTKGAVVVASLRCAAAGDWLADGHKFMKTPHLDALAATGLLFDFAYTNFAYCAPSRNSFMSGRRPDRTRALNFRSTFRECRQSQAPGCGPGAAWVTMPQFFRSQGYFTSSAGKVLTSPTSRTCNHPTPAGLLHTCDMHGSTQVFHDGMDDPPSWSYPSNQTKWMFCSKGDLMDEMVAPGQRPNFCGVTEASQNQLTDEDLALAEGLKRMRLASASGKPWWISIGVHRPHTVFRVPAGFHGPELYPKGGSSDVVKPPMHPEAPLGAPWMSGNWQGGDINDPAHSTGRYQGWPEDIDGCPNW